MNTLNYILSSTALDAGNTGINLYQTGITNFRLSLGALPKNYLKLLVQFSNEDQIHLLQSRFPSLSNMIVEKVFHPTKQPTHTYTVEVSGMRQDLQIDFYKLNLGIGKPTLQDIKNVKVVNSYLHTTSEGSNNLFLTLEAQNPRFVGNVVIPYEKNRSIYIPLEPEPFVPSDLEVLRTEVNSYPPGTGYSPVVTTDEDYIIREFQRIIYIIACDEVHDWPVEPAGIMLLEATPSNVRDTYAMQDQNEVSVTPQILLVPEDANEYSLMGDEEINVEYAPPSIGELDVKLDDVIPAQPGVDPRTSGLD